MDTASVGLVFGAFGGIGQACVRKLLESGYKVLCTDLKLTEGVEKDWLDFFGENFHSKKCDVRKSNDIEDTFRCCKERFGTQPSLVFNCVGIIDEFNWEKCIDINLNGTIRIMMATLDHIGKKKGGGGGSLLLLSSVLGIEKGPNLPVYTATKHGIVGLVRSWAAPIHAHGVSISCICPTAVDTPLLVDSVSRIYYPETMHATLKLIRDGQPIISPDELAEEMVRIAQDPSSNGRVFCMSKEAGCQEVKFEERPRF